MKIGESEVVKVLYLFTGIRGGLVAKVKRGEDPGDGTWVMLRLPHFGVEAEHRELEDWFADSTAKWLRFKVMGVYGAHVPFFFHFFKYDIVFTAGAFISQLFFAIAQSILRFHRPLWVMHDFSIMGFIGEGKTMRQKIFRFMTSRAGGIVTVGKEEKNRLEQMFPHLKGKIEYVPFGVDINFFQPQKGVTEKGRSIISVGVDPDRDWATLYAACEGLNVSVVAATRPRGNRDVPPPAFVHRGLFPITELVQEYARAQIAVIALDPKTGINDAMGCTALFEAMAMGKAIVATSTHTMRSYITHGENGLLVPEGDVVAMRAALEDLLNDSEKRARIGHAARAYALEHLDAEKLAGKLAEFFKRLLAQK